RLRSPAALAGHRRHRELGDQRLLLPAHRHRDVLPRVERADPGQPQRGADVRDRGVPAVPPRDGHPAKLLAQAGPVSLEALAARPGGDVEYVGGRGEPVIASRESLIATLEALGHDTRDPARAFGDADAAWWDAGAPPVVTHTLPLRVRADRDGDWPI